ncbi:MAG: hypothetical protein AUI14_00990 [Actinobacteria bacterium 13_2_20CM_2_71_6]|nr:MAG: hypothetical protein AUI14_00990 [Actinobacteria bacterium 13_2_20CM_2_71_6]
MTAADASLRASYIAEVLQTLYPSSDAGPSTEFVAVPNARRPRLLVPAGSRRVAAGAVRRYAQPAARTARLKRDLAAWALRTGVDRALLRDRITVTGADTIDSYLRTVLDRDVAISVHIGPARANRKPVLQLLSPEGETVGFAKLGTNALTRRLVRLEATALAALHHARLSTVVIPRILHTGRWQGHEVLVQEALPAWQPRRPARLRLPAAMREVASCLGITAAPLRRSPYLAALAGRLSIVDGGPLRGAVLALVDRRGHTALEFGAWHGDWAPWNMAALADSVLVWDWERFTPGVPLGFDAIHHELQLRLERGEDAGTAVDATLAAVPALLATFAVAPDAAEVTALLYLIDLATRYLADRQAEAGARLGVLGSWLLPVLVRRVGEL